MNEWDANGPRLTTIRFRGNAPAHVDDLIYQAVSPALVTYVAKGTTGWNRDGGDELPDLWPTNGVCGRKIAYWGDKTVKPFEPEGPYGIHMQPEPGCEDGADYVLGKLCTVYLPRAVRYYGDPFGGKKPSRIYTIKVDRGKSMAYRPGTDAWLVTLAEGRDTYEFSLDYLASSVLTVCKDANWASFVFYVNRFVEGDAKGQDPVSEIKRDIEKGLSKDTGDGNSWCRAHAPMWAALEELRENHPDFILKYCTLKNKRFAEGKLPAKLSARQMAELLGEVTGEDAVEIFARYGLCSQEKAVNGAATVSTAPSKKKRELASERGKTLAAKTVLGAADSPTARLVAMRQKPPQKGDLKTGVWYSNFTRVKEEAERRGLPFIAMWTEGERSEDCHRFTANILEETFTAFVKGSKILYWLGGDMDNNEEDGRGGKGFSWCRGSKTTVKDIPFVAVTKKVKGVEEYAFHGSGQDYDGCKQAPYGTPKILIKIHNIMHKDRQIVVPKIGKGATRCVSREM